MKNLRERAKELQNSLPFMEGKEKGDMKRIVNMTCTIRDYGFLQDEDDKTYVCFMIDEDPQNFYFGGQVITDDMQELEKDGYHKEILKEGLPVLFGLKTASKSKREYVTVTFYPETVPFKEKETSKSK